MTTKDVPAFRFPPDVIGNGKCYRHLLEVAIANASASHSNPATALHEEINDLNNRVGTVPVDGAAAIAFAILGHIYVHGDKPELPADWYR